MSIVAFFAVTEDRIGMGQVALGALRDFSMNVVAERAVKSGMLALAVLELSNLERMAVKTSLFACKRYVQRGVRIFMTIEAASYFEMRFPSLRMALRALRNRLLHVRRMTGVAAYAGNTPVFPSSRGYIVYPGGMAFHAIFFFILYFYLCRRAARQNKKRDEYRVQAYYNNQAAALY